jgi:hypothetical protein
VNSPDALGLDDALLASALGEVVVGGAGRDPQAVDVGAVQVIGADLDLVLRAERHDQPSREGHCQAEARPERAEVRVGVQVRAVADHAHRPPVLAAARVFAVDGIIPDQAFDGGGVGRHGR